MEINLFANLEEDVETKEVKKSEDFFNAMLEERVRPAVPDIIAASEELRVNIPEEITQAEAPAIQDAAVKEPYHTDMMRFLRKRLPISAVMPLRPMSG